MSLQITITGLAANILLFAVCHAASAEQPPPLSTNPFERPAWLGDARTGTPGEAAARPGGRIDLRATLSAGKGSLADVGGKVIGIGEEANGYLLLSVAEGTAVFSSDDEIIRVSIRGDDQDDGNETE